MKIVLTTTSPSIDSTIDPRFGRGAYFIVVDLDTMDWHAHPNPATNASGGAGTQAAQYIANQQAELVISGDFGPNAYDALHAAGIHMMLYGSSCTGREAVEAYRTGKLAQVNAPTGPGHHRRGW